MKKSVKLNYRDFSLLLSYIGLLIGVFLGVLYAFGGLFIDTLVSLGILNLSETPGLSIGTLYAFGALIGMPIIGALLGFITGNIGAFLYNLCLPYSQIKLFDIYNKD